MSLRMLTCSFLIILFFGCGNKWKEQENRALENKIAKIENENRSFLREIENYKKEINKIYGKHYILDKNASVFNGIRNRPVSFHKNSYIDLTHKLDPGKNERFEIENFKKTFYKRFKNEPLLIYYEYNTHIQIHNDKVVFERADLFHPFVLVDYEDVRELSISVEVQNVIGKKVKSDYSDLTYHKQVTWGISDFEKIRYLARLKKRENLFCRVAAIPLKIEFSEHHYTKVYLSIYVKALSMVLVDKGTLKASTSAPSFDSLSNIKVLYSFPLKR